MNNKLDIKFIDTSKEVKNTLSGLAKTALREAGKEIRKVFRNNLAYRTKNIKNHVASWAFIDKNTGQPQLQIGYYSWQRVKKRGKLPSHASPYWVEHGTRPHQIKANNAKAMGYSSEYFGKNVSHPGQRATNVLRNSVYDNIELINQIEKKYLSEMNNTLEQAGMKIFEGEEEETD